MNRTVLLIKNDFIQSFLLVTVYSAVFYGLQLVLYRLHIVPACPTTATLNHWDASWYKSIVINDYQYEACCQSNSGFFFLFPFIWKLLQLNEWGICCFNVVLFASGFSLLTNIYKVSFYEKLLWLSVPTVFYIFVPYSEALFFCLSSLCVWAIVKNKRWIIWVSLFLLSLTRATAIYLVAAFFFMELLGNDKSEWRKSMYRFVTVYVFPIITGLGFFVWYQYYKTGVWFAYFIQQAVRWNRHFSLPEVPLHNRDSTLEWLSAIAVFVCFVSVILLVLTVLRWGQHKKRSKIFILSVGYLFMNLSVMVFFNVPTIVLGVFRYGLLTPFFYVFLYYFSGRLRYGLKDLWLVLFVANFMWLFFGAFKHIDTFLLFSINTLLVLGYMVRTEKKWKWVTMLLMAVNFFFQFYFFQLFIGTTLVD